MWLVWCLPDVESDMSRYHRIEDMYAMPAPKFFRFAERLRHYDGAVTSYITQMQEEYKKEQELEQQRKTGGFTTVVQGADRPIYNVRKVKTDG